MIKRKFKIKPILIVIVLLLNTFFIVSCKEKGDPNRKTSSSGLNSIGSKGEFVVEDEEKPVIEKIEDGKTNPGTPRNFQYIFDRKWEARLYPPGDDFENYMVFLTFDENGNVTLQKGLKESEADEIYVGTYEIFLDEESPKGHGPEIFKFDLKLDYSAWGEIGPEKIRGLYFSESDKDGSGITFWLSDGDPFHEGVDEYKFFLQHEPGLTSKVSIWDLSEEMVFEYLMSAVPKVNEMVMLHGMALVLEDNKDTFIDGINCRTVWLGTNHEEHFVREILYAIEDYGKVYEYDVVNDEWLYMGN